MSIPAWLQELKDARHKGRSDGEHWDVLPWTMNRLIRIAEAAELFKKAQETFITHRYGEEGVLSCCDCRLLGVSKCLNGGKELNEQAIAARKNLFAVLRGDTE